MTDPTTNTDTDDEEATDEQLYRVQSAVAQANSETAAAVHRTANLIDTAHPVMSLANAHDELLDAYSEVVRALDTIEQTMDAIDPDYGSPTPRQIVDEHADRLEERYEPPALTLALLLLERNRREWLHHKDDTNGADAVRRHGLTSNQRAWLDRLRDGCGESDAE